MAVKDSGPAFDLGGITQDARELTEAIDAAILACNSDEKLLLLKATPSIRQSVDLVIKSLRPLRESLNPDGFRASMAELRLFSEDMRASIVYGDYSNIERADLIEVDRIAVSSIRESADSLFAFLSGTQPDELEFSLRKWRGGWRSAVSLLESCVSSGRSNSSQEKAGAKRTTSIDVLAVAYLTEHPSATHANVARAVKCHEKSLTKSRCPKYHAMRGFSAAPNREIRGYKDDEGNLEAFQAE